MTSIQCHYHSVYYYRQFRVIHMHIYRTFLRVTFHSFHWCDCLQVVLSREETGLAVQTATLSSSRVIYFLDIPIDGKVTAPLA